MKRLVFGLAAAVLTVVVCGQRIPRVRISDSGGPLSPEQASYDVLSYDLALEIDPGSQSIQGALTLEARVLRPLRRLQLDLDSPLRVDSATWLRETRQRSLDFKRTPTQILIELPGERPPGDTIRVRIGYQGKPKIAPRPPWEGGFIWSKTASGLSWIAVACQLDGADLWWPVKDHPSDEPDRMDLRFTVPEPLLAVSNGTLVGVEPAGHGRRTFHWRVDNPINAYNVTVNAAPYRAIQGSYRSVTGQSVPMTYWVLPENYSKGLELFKQFPLHLEFLERTIGPYPFRDEKYGVVETPYLGMEHQTIIAYGNQYRNNAYGFDGLHFHELAHEWWGNLVTVRDWKDYWIHEGFATYMECLYAESLGGRPALEAMTASLRPRLRNQDPLAPRESRSSVTKYFTPPEYVQSDGDVNFKGALVLHTLRWLIGDEAFFESLRRFAYPDPSEAVTVGHCRCRFVDSEDFIKTVERVSGRDLDWFFEVYLRQPRLPRLETRREGSKLKLEWKTPNNLPFPMPVQITADGRTQRLAMPEGKAELEIASPDSARVDPAAWLLREP